MPLVAKVVQVEEHFLPEWMTQRGYELCLLTCSLVRTGTVNLEKAFNSRLGRGRKDDMLCERWMEEPMPEGPGKGWKAEDYLEELKSEYYEWHGWDGESSLQKRATLEDLGMADVAEVLSKESALA